jgi:3-oxoacyl-[acyl-carrier protein] reductase
MNILITGGASGLGASITKKLASNPDNNVYFTYSLSRQNALEIEKDYKNTKGLCCDFKNKSSIDSLLSQMDSLDLDILINNAYTGLQKKHFHKVSPDFFMESFSSNIIPTIQFTQKALLIFRKKKFGKIITVLSSAIINTPPIGWSEYVATKNYLLSLSKSWATENINFNISSNCISPSFMKTALTSDTDERILEEMEKNHPLNKLLTTEEVAESIAFMTQSSQHINGTNLLLNAGSNVI